MTDQTAPTPPAPTPAGSVPAAPQPPSTSPATPGPSTPLAAVSDLPVAAEPGNSTSEYGLTKLAGGVVAVANGALGVASAFGAHITGPQLAAIGGLEGSLVGLVGFYALSRGIRKRGTPG
jgi:hypothetical protein